MADLSPDLAAKLWRLLPRLASDSPGDVNAIAHAIRRTLDRAGMDLHDLAARLNEAPRPVQPSPGQPTQPNGGDAFALAQWLCAYAADILTTKQRDFVETSARLLSAGRALTPKQSQWLRDLYAQHVNPKDH